MKELTQENEIIIKNYIERELSNSEDQFQLTVEEALTVFKESISAIEEVRGKEINEEDFINFLDYYKIIKMVEKISENIRTEKYLETVRKYKGQVTHRGVQA